MKRIVEDVMTRKVVTTHPWAAFKEVARLLREAGVSALPVVDESDRLLGIVSEGDLLLKERGGNAGGHRPLFRGSRRAAERRKAAALVAADLMSAPVITVAPDATLAEAARLMHDRGVKRLPVVDPEGRVVGIVSRQDLVKIFLRPDEEIRDEVVHGVIERILWVDPRTIRVEVAGGVVSLEGRLERRSLAGILIELVRGLDGVVGVDPRLSYDLDDTHLRPEAPIPWGVLPPSLRYP